MDQIDRLERLAKLRADGALTEEEYQAQKAIVLQSAAPPLSPTPSSVAGTTSPSPAAGGVIEGAPPKNRNAQILMVSLALLAGVLVVALAALRFGPLAKIGGGKPDEPGRVAVVSTQPTAAAPAPDPTKEQAFAVVYPGAKTLVQFDGESAHVRFKPLLLHRLDDNTFVLLSVGQNLDEDCHACQGYYSIAYLGRFPALELEGAPFVRPASMGGWGQPPELALLKSLGPEPMVLVRGGGTGQGESAEGADLVLLGQRASDVTVVARDINLSYDNGGAANNCSIEGVIRPKAPGKSFIVRYTGTFTGDVLYQRTGATYAPPAGTPELWKRCPDNAGE